MDKHGAHSLINALQVALEYGQTDAVGAKVLGTILIWPKNCKAHAFGMPFKFATRTRIIERNSRKSDPF